MKVFKLTLFIFFFYSFSYSQTYELFEFDLPIEYRDSSSASKPYFTKEFEQFNNFRDRTYVKGIGIDAYKDDIHTLIGKLIYKNGKQVKMGTRKFIKDSLNLNSKVPINPSLISYTYTKNSNTSIGLFIGVTLELNEVVDYSMNDILTLVIDEKDLDKDALFKRKDALLASLKADEELHIVTGVTVTEISKKSFTKNSRRIKANDFPVLGTALTFDNYFYVSTNQITKFYRIGLSISDLKRYFIEYDDDLYDENGLRVKFDNSDN